MFILHRIQSEVIFECLEEKKLWLTAFCDFGVYFYGLEAESDFEIGW